MSDIAKRRVITMTGKDYQPTEEAEQAAFIECVSLMQSQLPELALLFHIPNGGYRPTATAAKLKAQGVKPGVPDLFLQVARGNYHGLWIELKRRRSGKLSPAQQSWLIELNFQNYRAEVAHGSEEACAILYSYLTEVQ